MSSITINGDTSGSVILQAPSVAGSTTLTLPSTSGTVLTSANTFANSGGPAFSAYANAIQTMTTTAWNKVTLNVEEFDTASCFDSTTNYRFTPNVAGYYQFNASINANSTWSRAIMGIYKNGSLFKEGTDMTATKVQDITMSALIYLNGTTDYVELYCYPVGTTPQTYGDSSGIYTFFQGFLARGA